MRTLPSMLTNFFVLSVIYYLFIHLFVCLLKKTDLYQKTLQKKDTENKKEVEGGGGEKLTMLTLSLSPSTFSDQNIACCR